MKTTTHLGCKILSLVVLLLIPFELVRVDGCWYCPHELSAAAQQSGQESQVTVPARPPNALHKGEEIPQPPEIAFAPGSRTVTIELQVQDPNGYFLPNIRPENFAVYEDGVRQKLDTVQVEHAPVSVALLLEFGGRYHELNKTLGLEVPQIGREILSVVGRDDKVAVFAYDSKLRTLSDFNQRAGSLDTVFDRLGTPSIAEANFYDALLSVLNRMHEVNGRKAVIVVSSGIDNSSQATYQQMLQAAKESAVPIYSIGLAQVMEREAAIFGSTAPFARIDWNAAEKQLEALSKASGGRAYVVDSDLEVPAIYDDIMENLRLRYVITYVSSNPASVGPPRDIRVELIDPAKGTPLKIHDSTGKVVPAKVYVRASYKLETAGS
jgi:VWFA-related protein